MSWDSSNVIMLNWKIFHDIWWHPPPPSNWSVGHMVVFGDIPWQYSGDFSWQNHVVYHDMSWHVMKIMKWFVHAYGTSRKLAFWAFIALLVCLTSKPRAYTSKGVYSFRYFLSQMRIPNLVMHIFILPNPFVVCSCIYHEFHETESLADLVYALGTGSTWMSIRLLEV